MAARSPARFLAPLALVAFAFALFMVVQSSTGGGTSGGGTKSGEEQPAAPSSNSSDEPAATGEDKGPRFYRVKPGDTPSAIAQRTGVPLPQILELNPDLDPQTLAPGQRITLRR